MSMQNRIINTHPEKAFWGLYLGGIKLDSDIFKATKIETQVLPEISPKIKELPNAIGNLYSGTSLGSRLITIELRALGTNLFSHVQMQMQLNNWLKPALYEPVELMLGFDTTRKIDVVLNSIEQEKDNFDLIISLEFLAPNPLWRGIEEVADLRFDGNFYTFNNPSNFNCRPTISLKLTQDVTDLLVASGDEGIIMGSDREFGLDKTPVDQFIINNPCESLNGFINTPSVYGASVIDGDSFLKIDTNNTKIELDKTADKPYGEQQRWSAISKTIQGRNIGEVKNWFFNGVFNFKSNEKDKKVVGKFQYEIMDNNGNRLCVLQVANTSQSNNNIKVNIWLFSTNGEAKQVVKDYSLNGKYSDFYGSFRVHKKGNVFEFSLLYYRGKRKQLLFKKYTDNSKKYSQRSPQSVAFAFIGFGGSPWVKKISANHIELEGRDKLSRPDSQERIIAKAGDIIEIDNAEGKIYKNDSLWLDNLATNSTFLSFENSDCVFGISPNVATDVKVVFVPVWI